VISIGIGALVLLAVAVVIAAAMRSLWMFVRVSNRDPLTPLPPNERSAWARRWAGLYVKRPDSGGAPHSGTEDRERRTENGGPEMIERVPQVREPLIPG
jgi:hypothetical protein